MKHELDAEWDIISLKETGTSTTLMGTYLKNYTQNTYEVLATNEENKRFVGIRAKHFERVRGGQDKEKARNKAFYGRVTAVDLIDGLCEVELMSDYESNEGYKVRSITMHGDTLTWFIVIGI
jgi:hypothetical protein